MPMQPLQAFFIKKSCKYSLFSTQVFNSPTVGSISSTIGTISSTTGAISSTLFTLGRTSVVNLVWTCSTGSWIAAIASSTYFSVAKPSIEGITGLSVKSL